MRSGLASLLETIDIPANRQEVGLQYHVKPIPNHEGHYFGRANSGAPCLLLSAKDSTLKAPIRLAAIEVSFAAPCTMTIGGDTERTETLTAIICTASDRVVQGYFAHVCETILQIVGASPSLEQVVEAVRRLVDLFQRLSAPARRSVVGLFGELYVIHIAGSPVEAAAAWRSTTDDRFDFSVENVRLEVKASGTRQRAHEFSLEQCSPPPNTDGVLVSLFVEASGGGISLLDLIERIEEQLGGDAFLLLKLQETIAEGLGNNVSAALSMRFDESLARSSLQVYELAAIPAVRERVPVEVSQVRFRSDLSRSLVADTVVLASRNMRLKSLLPRRQ
jgi:hypothetical protein